MKSSLTLGTDTITDLTGDGLSIVNGALTAETSPLGNSITSSEIVDGTISEVDLLSSNTPGNGKLTIVDSTNYEFMIDDNESRPLSAGEWEWSLATYCTADGSDDPLTLWRGSMSIVKKV